MIYFFFIFNLILIRHVTLIKFIIYMTVRWNNIISYQKLICKYTDVSYSSIEWMVMFYNLWNFLVQPSQYISHMLQISFTLINHHRWLHSLLSLYSHWSQMTSFIKQVFHIWLEITAITQKQRSINLTLYAQIYGITKSDYQSAFHMLI